MEYTRKKLALHLIRALAQTCTVIGVIAISIWVLVGSNTAIALCAGAAIIAGPQSWLAWSMFSRFGAQVPTLLGIAKFSLSGLLFGVWFVKAQDPQPGALFSGAIVVLVCSPVFYYLAAKKDS